MNTTERMNLSKHFASFLDWFDAKDIMAAREHSLQGKATTAPGRTGCWFPTATTGYGHEKVLRSKNDFAVLACYTKPFCAFRQKVDSLNVLPGATGTVQYDMNVGFSSAFEESDTQGLSLGTKIYAVDLGIESESTKTVKEAWTRGHTKKTTLTFTEAGKYDIHQLGVVHAHFFVLPDGADRELYSTYVKNSIVLPTKGDRQQGLLVLTSSQDPLVMAYPSGPEPVPLATWEMIKSVFLTQEEDGHLKFDFVHPQHYDDGT